MIRFTFFLFVPFLLLFINKTMNAQTGSFKDRLYIEGDYHYGFVTPQHDYITYFIDEHVKGYQLNVGLFTDGTKQWHKFYNFPQIGLGVYHSGLGNSDIYGNITALYAFVDRYYFNKNSRFNFGNRISFGLGYLTKKYDKTNDYFNMAIGSNLNVYLNYSIEGLLRITPQLRFKMGLGFTHTSNGNLREPNKGLNMVTSFVALQYSLQKQLKLWTESQIESVVDAKNQYVFFGSFGRKQISRSFNNMYTVTSFSAEYSRKITRTGWLGITTCFYIDPSIIKDLQIEYLDSVKTSPSDMLRVSLNLSYELKMGKLSYLFQPGYYLKNAYTKDGMISNRIGLRYLFNDRLLASVIIKAHWLAVADFIEWGIGYRFKN